MATEPNAADQFSVFLVDPGDDDDALLDPRSADGHGWMSFPPAGGGSPGSGDTMAPPDHHASPVPPRPRGPTPPSIDITLGDEAIALPCQRDAVAALVLLSYRLGGFHGVLGAWRAIWASIDPAVAERRRAMSELRAARDKLSDWKGYRDDPAKAGLYEGAARSLEAAQRNADRRTREADERRRAAETCVEQFRAVWTALCVVEDTLLARYEEIALAELRAICARNSTKAGDEWRRYGAYVQGGTGRQAITLADAANVDPDRIRLGLTDTDLEKIRQSAFMLRQAEEDLKYGLDTRLPHGGRATNTIENASQRFKKSWDDASASDPVILQIYRAVEVDTSPRAMRELIVRALLRVSTEATALADEARALWRPGVRYRLEPSDVFSMWGPFGEMTSSPQGRRYLALPREFQSALLEAGLTVPASVVAGATLTDRAAALRTPWVHQAVRLSLQAQSGLDGRLADFTEPGRLGYAAVCWTWDAIEESWTRSRESQEKAVRLLWGAAILLAPFTEGGSLAAAGLVQAALCGMTIVDEATLYRQRVRFASATLDARQASLWLRPSTSKLVGTIIGESLTAMTSVVPPGKIPLVVDLLLGAAAAVAES